MIPDVTSKPVSIANQSTVDCGGLIMETRSSANLNSKFYKSDILPAQTQDETREKKSYLYLFLIIFVVSLFCIILSKVHLVFFFSSTHCTIHK